MVLGTVKSAWTRLDFCLASTLSRENLGLEMVSDLESAWVVKNNKEELLIEQKIY